MQHHWLTDWNWGHDGTIGNSIAYWADFDLSSNGLEKSVIRKQQLFPRSSLMKLIIICTAFERRIQVASCCVVNVCLVCVLYSLRGARLSSINARAAAAIWASAETNYARPVPPPLFLRHCCHWALGWLLQSMMISDSMHHHQRVATHLHWVHRLVQPATAAVFCCSLSPLAQQISSPCCVQQQPAAALLIDFFVFFLFFFPLHFLSSLALDYYCSHHLHHHHLPQALISFLRLAFDWIVKWSSLATTTTS